MSKARLLSATLIAVLSFLTTQTALCESVPLPGHVPLITNSLKSRGRIDANKFIELSLVLRLRNQEGLNAKLDDIYNPASPNFRHFLTAQEFLDSFGPTEADYRAALAFARTHRFTVMSTTTNRALIHVKARATDVESAFDIQLLSYIDPETRKPAYAPNHDPSVDPRLPFHFIAGLNNFSPPVHQKPQLTPVATHKVPYPHSPGGDSPTGSFGGNDFRAAYAPDVTLTGQGQVVGILALDGFLASDIATYEANEGLPNVPVKPIPVDGGSPPQPSDCNGLDSETPLDIEQVIAMAPGLTQINVYAMPNGGGSHGVDALAEVLHPTHREPVPNQLSDSWLIVYDKAALYPGLAELKARGIGFFAASGDTGAYTTSSKPFPPTDDPNVTSVGGTVLTTDAAGNWSSEVAWSSSGGGISPWGATDPEFQIPDYQKGMDFSKNGGSTTVRNVPDVAMVADDIRIVCRGNIQTGDGTSAAAPLWAAFEALANEQAVKLNKYPIGKVNSSVYAIGKGRNYTRDFHDITSGTNANANSNGLFVTQTGYDLVTGWGTPTGMTLINDLVNMAGEFNCTPLTQSVNNLQTQLKQALAHEHTIVCRGPASFECVQAAKIIQSELSEEIALANQHHCPI